MIKRALKIATKLLNSLSIRKKLLFTYFILIVLPLVFFTYLTYSRVSNVVQEHTFASASQVFNEAAAMLDKNFNNINSVIGIITHDKFIYDVSSNNPEDYDVSKQLEDSNSITSMFNHLKETADVDNIRVYVNKNFVFSDENVNMFNIENIKSVKWYNILSSQTNNTLWCPPSYFDDQPEKEQNFFSAARIIYNRDILKEKLAILRVDVKKDKILKILDSAALTKNGCVMLVDKNSLLLSSSSPNNQLQSIDMDVFTKYPSGKWNSLDVNGEKFFVNYTKLKLSDWYIASWIPYGDVLSTSYLLRNEMMVYMLIIAAFAYILAFLITKSSVKRLSLLTQTMRRVQKGDLKVELKKSGSDEIGELMESFNDMVSQISVLLEEKYKLGQEIKNSELKALQAQINPHFLYNSLDLINCTAIKHNIPDIVSMVNALARFYKLSLSRGRDVIPIKDEITHVKIYVQIQNMRFENRIKLEINIDEEIYKYFTQKIILQPIVENSIIHGIFEKESKSGAIRIFGKLQGETIIFLIEDDGIGMTDEKIQEVLSREKASHSKGYGIKNINDRIKLAYGEKYGLTYTSIPGEGTRVEVRIPMVEDTCLKA